MYIAAVNLVINGEHFLKISKLANMLMLELKGGRMMGLNYDGRLNTAMKVFNFLDYAPHIDELDVMMDLVEAIHKETNLCGH